MWSLKAADMPASLASLFLQRRDAHVVTGSGESYMAYVQFDVEAMPEWQNLLKSRKGALRRIHPLIASLRRLYEQG